jgi:integrase/recombinase XerD
MNSSKTFPALIQSFFTERLLTQRRSSAHTIAGYRDSFRLLLGFATQKTGKTPSNLALSDLDAPLINQFLDHLEVDRGNGVRTRNFRLAAIHSFFRYVSLNEPAWALLCQRILAIPSKRWERTIVGFLEEDEIEALLEAPDTSTWFGRRDQALLLVAVQTGLRVSELVDLRVDDVTLGKGAHVHCRGKGRKERCTPLRKDAASVLGAWLKERKGASTHSLFPSMRQGPLSRDAVARIVAKHSVKAGQSCPSIKQKIVTPHMLRHSCAMSLLRSGVDCTVIALWLGHESVETTQIYLHADMRMKEKALARTTSSKVKPERFKPTDDLLAFLENQ